MKSKICVLILGVLLSCTTMKAQWQQLDVSDLRTSQVMTFLYDGTNVYANCGFSFMRFDPVAESWSYSGNGLFASAPYNFFEKMIMYDSQIYTRYGNHIMIYHKPSNTWQEVNISLPGGVPTTADFYDIGATNDFFFIVVTWWEGMSLTGNIYTTTDFQTWNQGVQLDESIHSTQVLNGNKDYIWLANPDGSISYSENGTDFTSVDFGTVPMYDNCWPYREHFKGELDGDHFFMDGDDSRLYRYNITTQDWDTISNNFPAGTFQVDYEATDDLIYVLAFNGINISGLISNNAGDTWELQSGGLGTIPLIQTLAKIGEQKFICNNLVGEVLISENNGALFTEKNDGFIAGYNYLEEYNAELYTAQVGDGLYKSAIDNVDFILDNSGLPNTNMVYMTEDIAAASGYLFAVLVESLYDETCALYYKSETSSTWTKLTELGVVKDMKIIGKDEDEAVYVYTLLETDVKAVEEHVYKVASDLTVTNISSLLSMEFTQLYNLMGNSNGELFVATKYSDGNSEDGFRILYSSDGGGAWSILDDTYSNFVYVEHVRELFTNNASKALSLIDDNGNPVYFIRTWEYSGQPYEHKIVRYNLENEQWEQIPQAGLPASMIYAGALTKSSGNYYLAMPYGLYISSDLSTWSEVELTGLRQGMVPNSIVVEGTDLFMGTMANGLWYADLSVSISKNIQNECSVYPNPVSGLLHIDNISDNAKITLYDGGGRVVFDSFANTNSIDLSNFAQGIYVLKIENSGNPIFKKIIVN